LVRDIVLWSESGGGGEEAHEPLGRWFKNFLIGPP